MGSASASYSTGDTGGALLSGLLALSDETLRWVTRPSIAVAASTLNLGAGRAEGVVTNATRYPNNAAEPNTADTSHTVRDAISLFGKRRLLVDMVCRRQTSLGRRNYPLSRLV